MPSMHHLLTIKRDRFLKRFVGHIPLWITPNRITAIRLFCIIPLYFAYKAHYSAIMLVIFLLAFFLDCIDGTLARERKQITFFGKIFDPSVDKLLFLLTFWWLCKDSIIIILFFWILAVEIFSVSIGLFGILFTFFKLPIIMGANSLGKIRTIFQVVGIIFYVASFSWCGALSFSIIFLLSGFIFGVMSMVHHVVMLLKNVYRS